MSTDENTNTHTRITLDERARGRRHEYGHGEYRVHCTSTLIRCNCYTNLTREWDQAEVVDIKRNKQPTLFENKLQLIIYSSTTNFHTGAYTFQWLARGVRLLVQLCFFFGSFISM